MDSRADGVGAIAHPAAAAAMRPRAGSSATDPAAYCRAVLPRVSRTFAINIRLLGGSFGETVRVAYLLCRAADTLEDSWPGSPAEIEGRFDLLRAALAGDGRAAHALAEAAATRPERRDDLDLLAHLPLVLAALERLAPRDRAEIQGTLGVMTRGMRHYAARGAARGPGAAYLDDEAELHDYCFVVAGCIGIMLSRLFARRVPAPAAIESRREALAPMVGEALQLTNIVLDWPTDLARGRCHVPAAWLARHGLVPADLSDPERPGVRALAEELERLARAALDQVPDYLATLPPEETRYRLFCLWPALWAAASLRHARRDPRWPVPARRARLPRSELWGTALGSVVWAHDAATVRARFTAV